VLGHVTMVSPKRPRSGFDLRYLPSEEAELVCWSRIVHPRILLPGKPAVHAALKQCRASRAAARIARHSGARKSRTHQRTPQARRSAFWFW
jgi:hypothetical protein